MFERAKQSANAQKFTKRERELLRESEALPKTMRKCGKSGHVSSKAFKCHRWTCAPGNPRGCCANQAEKHANAISFTADAWLRHPDRSIYLVQRSHIGRSGQGLRSVFRDAYTREPIIRIDPSAIAGSMIARQIAVTGGRWAVRQRVLVAIARPLTRTVDRNLRAKFAEVPPLVISERTQASGLALAMAGDHGGRLKEPSGAAAITIHFPPFEEEVTPADLFRQHLIDIRDSNYRNSKKMPNVDRYVDLVSASGLRRFEPGSSAGEWGEIRDVGFDAAQRRDRAAPEPSIRDRIADEGHPDELWLFEEIGEVPKRLRPTRV